MRNRAVFALLTILALATGASADTGARPGSQLGGPPPIDDVIQVMEGFDDITDLPGWSLQNQSEPLGLTDWFQGNDAVFPAHAGAPTAYIGANFNNTAGTGTISNWLLTPELDISDASTLSFWTRTVTGNTFPDRLEVRMSTDGASTDVGTGATDVGDFTELLVEINPNLDVGGYPQDWTEFMVNPPPVPAGTTGRFGFRYFVTNAGPTGVNSNYIGIDTVDYDFVAPPEEPDVNVLEIPTLTWGGLALLALLIGTAAALTLGRRRRTA